MKKLDKSKLVMGLSKKYKLAPYLDKVLREFDEPFSFDYAPKEGDLAWHPSGDCTPTVQELYAKASEVLAAPQVEILDDEEVIPSKISESLRKTFLVGHYWHQLLQYIVLEKLEFCNPKAIERKGLRMWGHMDDERSDKGLGKKGMIGHPKPFHFAAGSGDIAPLELPRGWKGVVDFKTMGSGQFKQAGIPSWAAAKYECQINIYMDFFEEERALILAINKDTPHDFKEWEFIRNQPLIDAIYEKWKFVSHCLDDGSVPVEHLEPVLPLTGPYEGT